MYCNYCNIIAHATITHARYGASLESELSLVIVSVLSVAADKSSELSDSDSVEASWSKSIMCNKSSNSSSDVIPSNVRRMSAFTNPFTINWGLSAIYSAAFTNHLALTYVLHDSHTHVKGF